MRRRAGARPLECLAGELPLGRRLRLPRPGSCRSTPTAVLDAEGSGLDADKSGRAALTVAVGTHAKH